MKKLIALIIMLFVTSTTAGAYYFPEPDWGRLLKEKEKMVNETDFELFVEGRVENAPYFGARLEPRGGAYIGMIAESSADFKPLGAYLTYVEGMNQNDLYVRDMVAGDNVVTMVGWTVYDMHSVDYNQVRTVLDNLSKYNKPMFIRFANEMNCSNLGDDPDLYKEVFKKVADMVHEYPNFAVVWSPIDLGSLDRYFEYYYPGDEYVDWVGVSCYPIKYFMGKQDTSYNDSVYFMTGDFSWTTNRMKPIIEFMEKNGIKKPVMISEGGVPTNNAFGEDLEGWSAPRMRNMYWNLLMKYPQVKMVNWFNTHRANEHARYDVNSYPYAVDIIKEARDSGAYITEYGKAPEFTYTRADKGDVLRASGGKVKLYTLAHIPKQSDITVNYSIDGEWYHSSNKIPYICNLDVNALSDGAHKMTIYSGNNSKDYTFYKRGQNIRFGGDIEGVTEEEIKVTLNGSRIDFADQAPVIIDGRTLVPVRAIFEALGAEVNWDGKTRTVDAVKENTKVSLKIDDKNMLADGKVKALDVPAQIINDRTMVPVRAISEAFECDVQWDSETRTVIIKN